MWCASHFLVCLFVTWVIMEFEPTSKFSPFKHLNLGEEVLPSSGCCSGMSSGAGVWHAPSDPIIIQFDANFYVVPENNRYRY
jgi:hypothetical protein